MGVVEAVVLGIVQGLTEFLPISSTAHLRIVPALLGWDDPGTAFAAVTQLGTTAAVLAYFWRDLTRIITTWFRSLWTPSLRGELDARMGWYVGLGTIPLGALGLAFSDQVETGARNLWLIAGALIVFGLVLLLSDKMSSQKRDLNHMKLSHALFIGFWQALALIPGMSRSGATITGALFLNYDREAAARYSFLLAVPAIVLSGLYELRKIGGEGVPSLGSTMIATVIGFVVAYATIDWMLKFVAKHSMLLFVIWRLALGGLIIALLTTGVLSAT